jgi:hypothetical protein
MRDRLLGLIEATDKILVEAQKRKKAFDHEAINWADLNCASAAHCVGWNGDEWDAVTIEEAAPECPIFHAFIAAKLSHAGYGDVEVRTEW